jgi:hypothetical protein
LYLFLTLSFCHHNFTIYIIFGTEQFHTNCRYHEESAYSSGNKSISKSGEIEYVRVGSGASLKDIFVVKCVGVNGTVSLCARVQFPHFFLRFSWLPERSGNEINYFDRFQDNFVSIYTLEVAKHHTSQGRYPPASTTYNRRYFRLTLSTPEFYSRTNILLSNPYTATLIENSELLKKPTGDRSTRKIVLKADTNTVKFNAGDHLGVMPANRPELVQVLTLSLLAQSSLLSPLVKN